MGSADSLIAMKHLEKEHNKKESAEDPQTPPGMCILTTGYVLYCEVQGNEVRGESKPLAIYSIQPPFVRPINKHLSTL